MGASERQPVGATVQGDGTTLFRVWAPRARHVSVVVLTGENPRCIPMAVEGNGYFFAVLTGVGDGDLYRYRLDDGAEFPDPASRCQPQGVHGPSQVIDPGRFAWNDASWTGIALDRYVIYELHVGTFTPEGTFEAVIPHLDRLLELGVTAVEVMPVAQFPGERNWGYDGVYPFAPQWSYGGPEGLKMLVDACHDRDLAVILDVVYNHLGPEGNYLHPFGPYFTDRYRTPWGDAVNFDGPESDQVRRFFIDNARYWVTEYHVDALRLDAVHGIFDFGARHFLRQLAEEVHETGATVARQVHIIAESDQNDIRLIDPPDRGGHGLDAVWNDDFHHALHTVLTGEKDGYYEDFGPFPLLVKAYRDGFVYAGDFSRHRRRSHGSSSAGRPRKHFVIFSQNHDQVGNRMRGDRLGNSLSLEQCKLAGAAVLLSPFIPLLFMGEEYGEPAPFPYFVSHGDPDLIEAVRRGRREEFASFSWQGEVPDPQDEKTFLSARLSQKLYQEGNHQILFRFYQHLIAMRRGLPPLARLDPESTDVAGYEAQRVLAITRRAGTEEILCLFNFSNERQSLLLSPSDGTWARIFHSPDRLWGGPGNEGPSLVLATGPAPFDIAPFSVSLYRKE